MLFNVYINDWDLIQPMAENINKQYYQNICKLFLILVNVKFPPVWRKAVGRKIRINRPLQESPGLSGGFAQGAGV